MNRFLIVFPDGRPPVGVKSLYQAGIYLKNSVPDVSEAAVYELRHNAVRNAWSMEPPRAKPVVKPRSAAKKPPKNRVTGRWSAADARLAIDMWNKGKTAPEIGATLNRTPRSVYQKLRSYHSSLTR